MKGQEQAVFALLDAAQGGPAGQTNMPWLAARAMWLNEIRAHGGDPFVKHDGFVLLVLESMNQSFVGLGESSKTPRDR
jgi:hypothetical protein